MGGRQFSRYNADAPQCVQRMGESPPACFDKAQWVLYLREAYKQTLNRPAARKKFERGSLPDYCCDCTAEHRAEMHSSARCFPPSGCEPPSLDQFVSSLPSSGTASPGLAAGLSSSDPAGAALQVRSDPAARVAGKVVAGGSGAPADEKRDRSPGSTQPPLGGNAQTSDASPPAGGRRGSADGGH